MDLTDEQWTLIEPLIPVQPRNDGQGRPSQLARFVLNDIYWILRT